MVAGEPETVLSLLPAFQRLGSSDGDQGCAPGRYGKVNAMQEGPVSCATVTVHSPQGNELIKLAQHSLSKRIVGNTP